MIKIIILYLMPFHLHTLGQVGGRKVFSTSISSPGTMKGEQHLLRGPTLKMQKFFNLKWAYHISFPHTLVQFLFCLYILVHIDTVITQHVLISSHKHFTDTLFVFLKFPLISRSEGSKNNQIAATETYIHKLWILQKQSCLKILFFSLLQWLCSLSTLFSQYRSLNAQKWKYMPHVEVPYPHGDNITPKT